ncbi:GSCFA domain-containing protein [Nocardia terpenica]|uniref:GSCFA family protein n=1 Tax=Nocardia terpenica TaxID=455432 RepID=A0A164LXQ9_9NOCA|nr:GSCFA domain-containing protein [Nocardia terpenica]KZM72846.1 GSCFA family protein [Nocardia terpenica]NQE92241.1 GSCFA domain-containing protein [Nocardia terpenica]
MNPYQHRPARAFWRPAVAEADPRTVDALWTPKFGLGQDDPIITAGSCFAARLGRPLIDHGRNWFNAEPAPPGLTPEERKARRFGEFSFRTGNIYTAAVLRQWLSWAFDRADAPTEVWEHDGRCYDPYRPAIEPDGFSSAAELFEARSVTLAAIRDAVIEARWFIFTLGLTEAWLDTADGTTYPACPGTVRGTFDPQRHAFHNYTFAEVHRDLTAALDIARAANPELRFVLTVSPVPLTATATDDHILVANGYSKSVLRGVAGQFAQECDDVDYFPSYELITGAPFRSGFYAPNLREVTPEGVEFVLRHFLSALTGQAVATGPARTASGTPTTGGDVCEDAVLDYYGPR